MDNSEEKKPLIAKGWLRVLLFVIAYLIISLLIAVPVILLLSPVKSSEIFNDLLQSLSQFASKDSLWMIALLEFVSAVICVFIFRKFIDRKSFASIGFSMSKQTNNMLAGFFIAPALIGAGSLILYFTKHLEWDDLSFDANGFFIAFGVLAFIAMSEEIVFRGYILNNLMQSFNKWVALIISSLLFTIFHLSNPNIGAMPLASLFLAGILFGLNYVHTKNLAFSFMLHFSWNLFQGPVFGYKISGIDFSSLLQIQLKGDNSITGGDFGFEGSFIATTLLFLTIVAVYLFYEKKFMVHSS